MYSDLWRVCYQINKLKKKNVLLIYGIGHNNHLSRGHYGVEGSMIPSEGSSKVGPNGIGKEINEIVKTVRVEVQRKKGIAKTVS